ncbi:unnamed protein product [Cyclocybe aegerita]|uniref:Uncharacterized protein n=1 Tax=Cyclocybe aegerita TaxID=1973307 RepID=A0A8S0VT53_CYCAE|nr:unnamed protein product [Cyclocybe aegerita]
MSTPPAPSHADVNHAHTNSTPAQTTAVVQVRPQKKAVNTAAAMLPKSTSQPAQQKKVPRRSSKPFINWFQRKLAGTVRGKRTENVPLNIAELGMGRTASTSSRPMGRITSSPLPAPASHHHLKHPSKADASSLARRKTRSISLNGDEELRDLSQSCNGEVDSLDQSSINRESIWSPASALEADDDASVRPIPPSAPPSPSPSRSSSSYLSDPRTFRSMAASTKPTTLLSIDLNGNGMAHIAQAPPAQVHRFAPHVRQSSSLSSAGLLNSGASITFSALPSAQPSSRPASLRNPGSLASFTASAQQTSAQHALSPVQAPLHTNHHPRNNPRPSSPPLDNASVLTLASSAFGVPNRVGPQNYPPSAVGDSASHYGGSIMFPDGESTSHYVLGDDVEERDFDASVRALRPRSSRRGSWESEASRWSARIQGTPSLARDRSLWTSNSIRTGTGGISTENGEAYETADDETPDTATGDLDDLDKDDSLVESPLEATKSAPADPLPVINEPAVESMITPADTPVAATHPADIKVPVPNHTLHRTSTETISHPTVSPNSATNSRSEKTDTAPLVEGSTEKSVLATGTA